MSEITPLPASGRIMRLQRKPREGRSRGIPEARGGRAGDHRGGGGGGLQSLADGEGGRRPGSGGAAPLGRGAGRAERGGVAGGSGRSGREPAPGGPAWGRARARARVRAGEVELEISKRCDPCVVLYGLSYIGQERGPGFVRTLRGRRGWFARVIRGGMLRVGMGIDGRARSVASLGMKAVAGGSVPLQRGQRTAPSRCGRHRSRSHPRRPGLRESSRGPG